jgi:hypothetical protein
MRMKTGKGDTIRDGTLPKLVAEWAKTGMPVTRQNLVLVPTRAMAIGGPTALHPLQSTESRMLDMCAHSCHVRFRKTKDV